MQRHSSAHLERKPSRLQDKLKRKLKKLIKNEENEGTEWTIKSKSKWKKETKILKKKEERNYKKKITIEINERQK